MESFYLRILILQMSLSTALTYLRLCSFLFISFEFVKAVGNSITKVSLHVGQEATARVMKDVAGQRPIYVRTLQKINLPEMQVVESFILYGERGVGGGNKWMV